MTEKPFNECGRALCRIRQECTARFVCDVPGPVCGTVFADAQKQACRCTKEVDADGGHLDGRSGHFDSIAAG